MMDSIPRRRNLFFTPIQIGSVAGSGGTDTPDSNGQRMASPARAAHYFRWWQTRAHQYTGW